MGNNKRKRNKTKNQQAVRRRSHSHETQNLEDIELAPRPSSVQQHADLRQDSGRQEYPSESRNLGHDRERQGQDPRQGGNPVEPAAPDQQDEEIGRLQRQIREKDQEISQLIQQLRQILRSVEIDRRIQVLWSSRIWTFVCIVNILFSIYLIFLKTTILKFIVDMIIIVIIGCIVTFFYCKIFFE
uniref:Uncharacterized protein n=1 Tax=Acrobeloides nanus TaxID=290746 RepID=A0A914CHM0_9BILA